MEHKRYYLREKKSHIFQERFIVNDFREFFNQKVLKLLKLRGNKIAEQQELALQIVYSLVLAGLPRHVVSDTRDTGTSGVRQRVRIWDAVIEAGLAIKCLGSQESGCNPNSSCSVHLQPGQS
ncbi:MAG TPA: hypothetical protein VNQ76_10390 [Planctomicrobium sp.]|nr:hypothetical protein [Planctomicrobium sp.]